MSSWKVVGLYRKFVSLCGYKSGFILGKLCPTTSPEEREVDMLMYRYPMNHEITGILIIINNRDFYPHLKLERREGTDEDAMALANSFAELGFIVIKHDNLTISNMQSVIAEMAGWDHSNYDCFAVAVLTHGRNGKLYGTDAIIDIDDLIDPLKSCKSLFKKPKLFFIQACRGDKEDFGVLVGSDSKDGRGTCSEQILFPLEADFLYVYSTVLGYVSWRNPAKGSWFIQVLCSQLDELAFKDIDLIRILTRVNHHVATEFESERGKKQVLSVESMLTREIYFTRKV